MYYVYNMYIIEKCVIVLQCTFPLDCTKYTHFAFKTMDYTK